jgi:hypothetical protein
MVALLFCGDPARDRDSVFAVEARDVRFCSALCCLAFVRCDI